ncbi:MAG: hypothetical protein JW881_18240 [Spirochaetales bacterium]|nr:hypothetical protein [Spirochaetales bacterium]
MIKVYGYLIIAAAAALFILAGCSDIAEPAGPVTEEEAASALNKELSAVMACYQKAQLSGDPAAVDELIGVLDDFDARYGGATKAEFLEFLEKGKKQSRLTAPLTDFPPLADLPLGSDGDVYLAGGANSLAGYLIDWVSPNATEGNYNHGAVFDLDKFDPTNLEAPCFQTAIEKGAGFETAIQWMTKQNVCVMKPVAAPDRSSLDTAQKRMDFYCDPANTNMAYGFFENTIDVFNMVTKSDNYYWYCTKVPWRVYNELGIDIDSNTSLIDWTTSGLYSIMKTYYNIVYFWSRSRAKKALQAHIDTARRTLVLAEEVYFSPRFSRCYEVVR